MRVTHSGAAKAVLAVIGFLGVTAAQALSLGQSDTFDADTQGWSGGAAHPAPPSWDPGGWLVVTGTGALGPGGRLAVFNNAQWTGDYTAAGITGLRMDLSNLGSTDLTLRLRLLGAGQEAISTDAVLLPAHSGWQTVGFSLAPAALTGPAAAVLGSVTELRLFHAPVAAFPGPLVAATLAIDNVTAVPEPASALMLLLGIATLAATGRRDRRAA